MALRSSNPRFFLAFRSYMLTQQLHHSTTTAAQTLLPNTHRQLSHDRISSSSSSSSSIRTAALHQSARQHSQQGQRHGTRSGESLGPQTFYEFFPQTLGRGPPPAGPFAIDLAALRREFYQLQAKAHPDRFGPEQKARAEGLSARINEAYKALQDPLRRAQYLLALKGIDVAEDETAKVDDAELLMEVLEMRETIEAVEDEAELVPLKERNDGLIERSVQVLDDAFARDDVDTAKEEAVKLRYWTNIKESLDAWEKGKPVVLVH